MSNENGSSSTAILLEGKRQGEWHIDLSNPRIFAERIGDKVLQAFMPCLLGVDRVVSLTHVFLRTREDLADPEDFHARERDSWFLIMLVAGTMYELGMALDRLGNEELLIPGAHSRVRMLRTWKEVEGVRKRRKSSLAPLVRNQIAHHLGDPPTYAKGLRLACERSLLRLYSADGQFERQGSYEGAREVVGLGLGIEPTAYEQFVAEMGDDMNRIHPALLSVFQEIAEMGHIPIEDRRKP